MNEDRKTEIEISVMDVAVGIIYCYTISFEPKEEDLYEVVDNLLIAQGHESSDCYWSTIPSTNIINYTDNVFDSKKLSNQADAEGVK